jgi:hypothetical protein
VFNSALSGYACGTLASVADFDSGPWLPSPLRSGPDRLAPARQQLPDAALTRGAQRIAGEEKLMPKAVEGITLPFPQSAG